MIIYDLTCPQDHRFEGWFASGDDFAAQKARDWSAARSATTRRSPSCRRPRSRRPGREPARNCGGRQPGPGARRVRPHPPPRASRRRRQSCGQRRGPVRAGRRCRRGRQRRDRAPAGNPAQAARNRPRRRRRRPPLPRGSAQDPLRRGAGAAIRGQASREETEALREEGIDVSPLPPFLTARRALKPCATCVGRLEAAPVFGLQFAAFGGPLAQLVEQRTFNPLVAGSNPVRPTIPVAGRGFEPRSEPDRRSAVHRAVSSAGRAADS